MKIKKIVATLTVITLLVSIFALPLDTYAKTIKEFEAEVSKYAAELQAKKDNLAKNDAEVAQIKRKISDIESQIKAAQTEIENLQTEINNSNIEIAKKSEESKKIIEYYQISNGENVYLEYAFGATSITDMIYRLSVVEQLTEYNDQIMKELKELIIKNEKQQKDLDAKKEELKKLQASLESEKERINADSKSIRETMPSIEEQIKSAKANVSYYKNLGCGATEDIQACQYRIEQSSGSSSGGSVPSTNGFFRPMHRGYITQRYGGYGGHLGIDLSDTNKSIEIYPIADGVVFFNGRDSAGALVVKIKHNFNGRYYYSTYAHMRSVNNLRKGQFISSQTLIGRMGSTGNSSGPHLHLEITDCDWNPGGGCSWRDYQKRTINPSRFVSFPSSWNNR